MHQGDFLRIMEQSFPAHGCTKQHPSGGQCKRYLGTLHKVERAATLPKEQLVKALNPNTRTKRDVVSYLRGLLLKSGKAAKVIAMGVKGNAVIKKGG
jgi:hypothetical protein